MKKGLLILIISLLVLWGSSAFAGHAFDNFMYCESSGEKTEDTTINTGPCFLVGVLIITDGTNNATGTGASCIVFYRKADSGYKIPVP